MAQVPGMLTLEDLTGLVSGGEVDTVLVVFSDLYGRLMGKRYDAGFFLEEGHRESHACDYLLTVDIGMNPVPGYRYANWEKGYGDVHLVPDLGTLRRASWLERSALVLCDVVDPKDHSFLAQAPRSMLRTQIEAAAQLGLGALAASELEYYLYANSYRDAAERGYDGLRAAGWYIEDYHTLQATREEPFTGAVRRHLRDSGIPVENSKGEWGLGQHELNIRYADVLCMADRHSVYKQCLREVAEQQGRSVSFMAKVDAEQAGSSCHVHLSLWEGDSSAFAGDEGLGPIQCSSLFRWFLGGWIAYAPEMMVFYAPTVNSYKRYQSGSWAPTRLAWSYDNRTAGFRVVGKKNSLRIECRIPGADCNPYLVYAAALASGLEGIRRRIEPPAQFEGDVYRAEHLEQLPQDLAQAVERFEGSALARAAFGEPAVEHYAHFYRSEYQAYQSAVTDWERQRYFEQI